VQHIGFIAFGARWQKLLNIEQFINNNSNKSKTKKLAKYGFILGTIGKISTSRI